MSQEQNQTNDVESFVTAFTEGLVEQPSPITDTSQQPATPEKEDQGSSDKGTEGAPAPSPDTGTPEQKDDPTDKDKATESEEEKPKVEEVFNKSDKAFAELRTQNKDMSNLFLDIARSARLNPKNAMEAFRLVKEHFIRINAGGQGIDESVLDQLREKDEALTETERTQIKQEAQQGFDKLKQTYGLSNTQLLEFAQRLQGEGINPFETRVDLMKEYRHANFESLLEKAREEGRQEELDRRTKAQTQASKPGTKVGATNSTGESIKTPDELRVLLGIK